MAYLMNKKNKNISKRLDHIQDDKIDTRNIIPENEIAEWYWLNEYLDYSDK